MNSLETLLERLKGSALSDSDKATAAALAGDLAGLLAAQAAGQDITSELAHIKAQAANHSAAITSQVAAEFRLWATQLAAGLVTAAL